VKSVNTAAVKKSDLASATGSSTTTAMTQKAVTDALAAVNNSGFFNYKSTIANMATLLAKNDVAFAMGDVYHLNDTGMEVYYFGSAKTAGQTTVAADWNYIDSDFDGSVIGDLTSLLTSSKGDLVGAINELYSAIPGVVQNTGSSQSSVMSQNAVTTALAAKANTSTTYTKTQTDALVSTTTTDSYIVANPL
jgi:hypothetical protein